MKSWLMMGAVVLGFSGPIFAEDMPEKESPQPDKRLIEALESEGLKYEVLETGELSVLIEWTDENRSQIVRCSRRHSASSSTSIATFTRWALKSRKASN